MSLTDPFTACIVLLITLAVLGLPVAYAMILASILYLLMAGLDMGTAAEQLLNSMYTSYTMLAVPLFILAAELMNSGSMTTRLTNFANALVGRFRGGLAQVNVLQSLLFAGMSGSAIADAGGMGKMMMRMMTQEGKYTPSFAAALTAVTAVVAPILPPSIPMVIYALVSNVSIGYLFLGGILPGLLISASQMLIVGWSARRNNFPTEAPVPVRELPMITLRALPALLLPVVLIVGLRGGVMTPTEAAAVAAGYALFVSVVIYRDVGLREFYASLLSAARTTTSIGMLIAAALVFNYIVTVENIPNSISRFLLGFDLTPLTFLLIVNVILLLIGAVLEGSTIILIIVPVLIPTAAALGIDPIHFGVVVVFNVMIGLVTPPYGLLLFVVKRVSGASMGAILRDTMPFLLGLIAALLLITLIPDIVLFMPRMFGYSG
ncbi:TRAP transporter large permease [Ketogulonicigenium vulgare]|uniref:TRAP transporter large permease protein n=2 Tax=Ketogulonicigenium vulgare TaxID=92945 RepID=F9Y730_KETVW|nr:TRAP transporter large permease [Ketogulonicigenium vulgare]AEM42220.1 putative TRAP-type C4-dicarboxylate transporter, large permease subunit (DctM) [Ketogulonicigenium vulgare WSH-001]ALJ79843.1 permease [Ketogulonicigenium vulgare]ANW32750.1 permease [Ketogulonicigenium vulgare]AOZ53053.1 TRAP-type C4-dicarboxylate transporter large permease subunit (DctM) [Ketogulonicigenium vulgare]